MSAFAEVSTADFKGSAEHKGKEIAVHLQGNADVTAPPALDELIGKIHTEANRHSISEAVIDIRDLEFMNSSSFKTLISWIMQIKELEQDQRYRLRFLSNPEQPWQKRSLETLRCFADDLIFVGR